jgi:hypothetical protein
MRKCDRIFELIMPQQRCSTLTRDSVALVANCSFIGWIFLACSCKFTSQDRIYIAKTLDRIGVDYIGRSEVNVASCSCLVVPFFFGHRNYVTHLA